MKPGKNQPKFTVTVHEVMVAQDTPFAGANVMTVYVVVKYAGQEAKTMAKPLQDRGATYHEAFEFVPSESLGLVIKVFDLERPFVQALVGQTTQLELDDLMGLAGGRKQWSGDLDLFKQGHMVSQGRVLVSLHLEGLDDDGALEESPTSRGLIAAPSLSPQNTAQKSLSVQPPRIIAAASTLEEITAGQNKLFGYGEQSALQVPTSPSANMLTWNCSLSPPILLRDLDHGSTPPGLLSASHRTRDAGMTSCIVPLAPLSEEPVFAPTTTVMTTAVPVHRTGSVPEPAMLRSTVLQRSAADLREQAAKLLSPRKEGAGGYGLSPMPQQTSMRIKSPIMARLEPATYSVSLMPMRPLLLVGSAAASVPSVGR